MTKNELKQTPKIQEIALKKLFSEEEEDCKITAKFIEEFCDGRGRNWYIFRELKTKTSFRVFEYDGLNIQPEGTQLTVGRLYELHWSMRRVSNDKDGMIQQKTEIRETLKGWMTTQEAAKRLKLEVSTVRAYVSRGIFPGTQKIGNTLYIPPSAINARINYYDTRELREKQPRTKWAVMRKNVAATREVLEKITDETPVDEMRVLVKYALDKLRYSSLAS